MLSGLIVDHVSYKWIFWFGLAVVLVAIVATRLFVPESPVKTPARIDVKGGALLSTGLVSLLLALSEGERWGWGSPEILGLFAAAAVILAVWIRFEQRVSQPLVDIRLLRSRSVWTTNLTGFLIGFGMFGSFILTPQFFQTPESAGYGFGVDVTGAGLFMLPSAAIMLVAGPFAGMLAGRVGPKVPLLFGTAFSASSFALLAIAHSEPWHVIAAVTLLGFGIGLSFASMGNLIVAAVPQTQTGEASESGFTTAFALGACALALALVAAAAIPGRRAAVGSVPARASEARASG